MTKNLIFAVTLMIVLAFGAFAADVTGKWTAQVPGRQGAMMERTFTFKADGATLTGTVSGFQGMDLPITDGKVSGDTISFVTTIDRGGNTFKSTYTGTVAGSEIKFKMEGGRGGPVEFAAKKAN
jgi:hypothetical protein